MLDKLKADFDGILELVNKTPQALQEMAFEMILERWFAANAAPATLPQPAAAAAGAVPPPPAPVQTGVPDAVKPFLTANGITTEILEKVFHLGFAERVLPRAADLWVPGLARTAPAPSAS